MRQALCGQSVDAEYQIQDYTSGDVIEDRKEIALGLDDKDRLMSSIIVGMYEGQTRTATIPSKLLPAQYKDIDIPVEIKLNKIKSVDSLNPNQIRMFDNKLTYQTPFLCVSAGGGMRMMESLISLSQMTRTTLAINELKKNNLPYIVCITDPTAGGITASYAMLGDIHIAEPGALIAFAGARVIRGTVKEELPEGFQKSEYVEKTGFVDLIVERKDLTDKIGTLLSILLKKNSAISTVENETTENSQSLSKVAS